MLFANAVFNAFTGAFDVTNCVQHVLNNMFAKTSLLFLLPLYLIIHCELCFLCQQFSSVSTH